MSLESLSEPIVGESPVGEDCQPEIQGQNLPLMTEYLVERALQKGRERLLEQTGLDEAAMREAATQRDDGRRRLVSLENILKDVLKGSTVNADQVAKGLRERTTSLLGQRGKDLRLLPHLCAAVTYIDGLDGYREAISLALDLLQKYPQTLYPLPDEDDPTDLWERANAVTDLLSGSELLALIGPVVVVDAKQSGRLTLAELVGGVHDSAPVDEVSQGNLDMAIGELGPEAGHALLNKIAALDADVLKLMGSLGAGALSSSRLHTVLVRATARVREALALEAIATEGAAGAESDSQGSKKPNGTRGELQSREDARRSIQEVIRFLERVEPSHPAPLLLKRADRLLGLSFFEIIKDMAPGAVTDIERLAGIEPQ